MDKQMYAAGTGTGQGTGAQPAMQMPMPPSYEQATGSSTAQAQPGQLFVSGRVQTTYTQPQPQPHAPTAPQMLAQQPPMVIIQHQAALPVGPEPTYITCPHCHVQKLSRIEYEPSSRTHLMAALLCLLGLWCFVCLPYCAGSCMNANHYCGNCNRFVGVYNNS